MTMGNLKKLKDANSTQPTADALSDTEYWETVAEIDATYFCIEELAKTIANRPPIHKMIDEATGWEQEQEKTLAYWFRRLKKLQAKLPPDDPHFIKPTLKLSQRLATTQKPAKRHSMNAKGEKQ